MNSPPAPVSRSIRASMVLFSRVVLHIMGVVNVIDCFPILATCLKILFLYCFSDYRVSFFGTHVFREVAYHCSGRCGCLLYSLVLASFVILGAAVSCVVSDFAAVKASAFFHA